LCALEVFEVVGVEAVLEDCQAVADRRGDACARLFGDDDHACGSREYAFFELLHRAAVKRGGGAEHRIERERVPHVGDPRDAQPPRGEHARDRVRERRRRSDEHVRLGAREHGAEELGYIDDRGIGRSQQAKTPVIREAQMEFRHGLGSHRRHARG
jgi:hypothetical protein